MQQITIKKEINISGIGLHSGNIVNMKLLPADVNTGIVFKRVDINDDSKNLVPAKYDLVKDTKLCTMLINDHGIAVGTIEHLMSALAFFGVDNLLIELDAPEVPILDGSSLEFVNKIKEAGLYYQLASKKVIRIIKPISLTTDKWKVEFVPSEDFILDVSIDFGDNAIGKDKIEFNLNKDNYTDIISKARTFCMLKDIEYLKSIGLVKGGSLDNAVVVDGHSIVNKEGLRYTNEFVRHKLLDAIGDLYLSGYSIKGKFIGDKCGHDANNQLLRLLMQNPDCYEIEDTISDNINFSLADKNIFVNN